MRTLTRLTILAAALLLTAPVAAETLSYDFLDYQDVTVGVPWTDQGLTFAITSNGSNDAVISTRYGLVLGTVILTVDLAPLTDVGEIACQIYTASDFTPTRVSLYSEASLISEISSSEIRRMETLTVNAGGAAARWLRITSDNSRLEEMTIQHGTVANEPATWSAVKTLYR
ncbi:MAG TPA: hypothetical protein P5571_15475 [Candidatus Krumholzibacteria bacterium]|mgnify:CR=1 FL=1|nr:hypothetical protein [Candidatus Krumholzibacteria bacterium]HRX52768.1 hypothetical protein [Candidatus Krumholzibacteria bacterium]